MLTILSWSVEISLNSLINNKVEYNIWITTSPLDVKSIFLQRLDI